MSVRISMCAALAVALLLPTAASTQEVDANAKLDQILNSMVTREDIKDLVTKDELQGEVDKLTTLIQEQDGEIKSLKNDLEITKETLRSEMIQQKQIIDVISRPDSQGKPILALNNIMKSSPEFRQELSGAVNNSLATEGTLVVNNKTSFDRFLKINNRETHRIPANTSQTFNVGVGTVTTELVGEEAPKNWTIAAPSNQQVVDIEPLSSQVIVQRPVVSESVIVQRPIVSESIVVQRPTVVVERPSVIVERPTVIVERPVFSTPVIVQRPSVVVQSPVIAAPPVFVGTPFVPSPPIVYERRGLFGRRLVPRFAY